jgi:hypothetical protein
MRAAGMASDQRRSLPNARAQAAAHGDAHKMPL